jgi:hypothetical protein
MKEYSIVNLDRYAADLKKYHEKVVKAAWTEVFEDTPVVPGIAKGGSRIRGTIPYDTWRLAESLRSTTGRRTQYGMNSWRNIIRTYHAGDKLSFTWGYGIDNYARRVHDGGRGIPGTFWTTIMAHKLPYELKSASERLKL